MATRKNATTRTGAVRKTAAAARAAKTAAKRTPKPKPRPRPSKDPMRKYIGMITIDVTKLKEGDEHTIGRGDLVTWKGSGPFALRFEKAPGTGTRKEFGSDPRHEIRLRITGARLRYVYAVLSGTASIDPTIIIEPSFLARFI
jgi:hypothetical protein